MNNDIYTSKQYQDEIIRTSAKEKELIRLLQVKSEKLCNNYLIEHQHTQLSYLTKEQQLGALALPKGLIINKLLNYLHQL